MSEYSMHVSQSTELKKLLTNAGRYLEIQKETGDRKMIALQLAFEGTTSKIEMLKIVKQLYQDLYPIADHDYGR